MENKFEVPGENFTEGKALYYLCSVTQCAQLSFMIKNVIMKRSNGIEFLNLVLKRYGESMENDF